MTRRHRLVVLASGQGTNAQAVIDASRPGGALPADVVAVVSDVESAPVLERARRHSIDAVALPRLPDEKRSDYDRRLLDVVDSFRPDTIVLAGWMRILSMAFLGPIGCPVVNLHPALPGELPGVRAIERAFAERDHGRRESGVMIHLVDDEGVDVGPVLGSERVPLLADDSWEEFSERMHRTERELLVGVLASFLGRSDADQNSSETSSRGAR